MERNRAKLTGVREKIDEESVDYFAVLLGDPCAYCGCATGSIDHIDPRGPSHWLNLTAACVSCNSKKIEVPLLRALLGSRVRKLRSVARDASEKASLSSEIRSIQPEHFDRTKIAKESR